MSLRRCAAAWTLAWACALACALLLAQTLGLVHGVVHGPQAQAPYRLVGNGPALEPVAGAGIFWLAPLFYGHDDDTSCRLYGQAGHGAAPPGIVTLSLPIRLALRAFDLSRAGALARWTALFDARGPPLTH